jgi:aminopeptidase N
MKKLLIAFLSLSTMVSAQNTYRSYFKDQTTYREHAIDITRMKVEVSFDTQKSLVKGKVTHSFIVLQKQVDSVFFDAPGINIKSALMGIQNLPFNTTDKGVWVKPNKPLQWDQTNTITFEYEATPRKGIYFIGWNVPENPIKNPFAIRKQIWTQGQGIDNRYWIPMYDDMNDKFITETVVTFENGYEVLSNGTLLKKTANKNNTTTWHYSMTKPHAGYLLMLGIGKYNIKKTKSARGVPMNLYYYPEYVDRAEPTYRYSEMMVDFLEQETGVNYPWESYSQIMVQDFLYGAMENTTATIFGDFFNVDERAYLDRNYVGVNCHELTHQWFGDYITARDVRDTWLQESWATYYPKMLTKKLFGDDAYNWQRRGEQNSAIEATKKDKYPIRYTGSGTARVYPKGSNVISMLSYVLGDEQWKRALNHYLKTHAYGNVETNDLQQAIQDKLGIDMSWFFDQWVLRGGEPQYTVHYEDLMGKDGSRHTEIAVEQTHQRDEVVGLFKMPIAFEVHYGDGSFERVVEMIQEQFEIVKVPNPNKKEIAFVLFDPNSMVIKTTHFKKTYNELKAQVINAPNMLDRYDALVALKDYDVEKKRELLMEVFRNEKFHAMKSEVITQLINDEVTNYQLLSVFNDKEPQAKLTFIKAYNGNNTFCLSAISKALTDNSYDVVQAAMEKICKLDAVNIKIYLPIVKDVYGMNNSVNIKYHELCISNNIDANEHMKALINYASNQWEFRTRNNAFASIKASGVYSASLIPHLFDAMLNTNSRLAGPAAELTNFLATKTTNLNDMQAFFTAANYTKSQKDILIKYVPGLK